MLYVRLRFFLFFIAAAAAADDAAAARRIQLVIITVIQFQFLSKYRLCVLRFFFFFFLAKDAFCAYVSIFYAIFLGTLMCVCVLLAFWNSLPSSINPYDSAAIVAIVVAASTFICIETSLLGKILTHTKFRRLITIETIKKRCMKFLQASKRKLSFCPFSP